MAVLSVTEVVTNTPINGTILPPITSQAADGAQSFTLPPWVIHALWISSLASVTYLKRHHIVSRFRGYIRGQNTETETHPLQHVVIHPEGHEEAPHTQHIALPALPAAIYLLSRESNHPTGSVNNLGLALCSGCVYIPRVDRIHCHNNTLSTSTNIPSGFGVSGPSTISITRDGETDTAGLSIQE